MRALDDQSWEIVGVLPPDFSYSAGSALAAEVFTPIAFRPDERVRGPGRNFVYGVLGRLKDGVTIETEVMKTTYTKRK